MCKKFWSSRPLSFFMGIFGGVEFKKIGRFSRHQERDVQLKVSVKCSELYADDISVKSL